MIRSRTRRRTSAAAKPLGRKRSPRRQPRGRDEARELKRALASTGHGQILRRAECQGGAGSDPLIVGADRSSDALDATPLQTGARRRHRSGSQPTRAVAVLTASRSSIDSACYDRAAAAPRPANQTLAQARGEPAAQGEGVARRPAGTASLFETSGRYCIAIRNKLRAERSISLVGHDVMRTRPKPIVLPPRRPRLREFPARSLRSVDPFAERLSRT